MNKYDIILEYTSSQDMLSTISANSPLDAAWEALDDSIYYRDTRYISMIEVLCDDKEKICQP